MPGAEPRTTSLADPVAENRFGVGPEYTVGVEEELMLVDADTLALVGSGEAVVDDAHDPEHVKREIRPCMVEITSTPCWTGIEVLADLRRLRRAVGADATGRGVRLVGAGTHPFSLSENQGTTATSRFQEIMDEIGYPLRRAVCCGMHVHVAVANADKAVQLAEGILPDLPLLLAVSASSPFWRGAVSGLASTRQAVWAGVPRTGLPPYFPDHDHYVAALEILRRGGAVPDASHVWWDVRPQARLGTIEVRLMDAQPVPEDSAALAGLVQTMMVDAGQRWDEGERWTADRFITAENRWLALRHGLEARLVDPVTGAAVDARTLLERLLDRLAPAAAQVDAGWALARVADIAAAGGAAQAQVDRYRSVADLVAVTRWLADLAVPSP